MVVLGVPVQMNVVVVVTAHLANPTVYQNVPKEHIRVLVPNKNKMILHQANVWARYVVLVTHVVKTEIVHKQVV